MARCLAHSQQCLVYFKHLVFLNLDNWVARFGVFWTVSTLVCFAVNCMCRTFSALIVFIEVRLPGFAVDSFGISMDSLEFPCFVLYSVLKLCRAHSCTPCVRSHVFILVFSAWFYALCSHVHFLGYLHDIWTYSARSAFLWYMGPMSMQPGHGTLLVVMPCSLLLCTPRSCVLKRGRMLGFVLPY